MIKKMNKVFAKIKFSANKILLAIFAILMLVTFGRFFSLLKFQDSSIPLEKGDPMINLDAKETIHQRFVANRSNLTKIEFLLRSPGPKPGDKVKVQIADENCNKTLRAGILEPSFLASNNLYEVSFEKIVDSQNKTYCIKTTFDSQKASAKALPFFTTASADQTFDVKNITTNEELSGRSLSIRGAYSNNHFWQDISELNQRMSQYKPWFLKHYFLGAITFFFVILSVSLIIILILL